MRVIVTIKIFFQQCFDRLMMTAIFLQYLLKKPDAIQYNKKNELKPFEDDASLGFFAQKSDAALFCLGYHSKKRPNTVCMGRLFDSQILDMFELSMEEVQSIHSLKVQEDIYLQSLFALSLLFYRKKSANLVENLCLSFKENFVSKMRIKNIT